MRPRAIAALLLAACTNTPNAQNVANDELAIDQAIDALHTAQAQILQLQAEVAAMKAALPSVPDGGMPTPVRVPHLIGPEGGDLGPFAGFDRMWSDAVGAYVRLANEAIYYSNADCTGDAFVSAADAVGVDYTAGREDANSIGTIWRLDPTVMHYASQSMFAGGQCMSSIGIDNRRKATDTGLQISLPNPTLLRIDLR